MELKNLYNDLYSEEKKKEVEEFVKKKKKLNLNSPSPSKSGDKIQWKCNFNSLLAFTGTKTQGVRFFPSLI